MRELFFSSHYCRKVWPKLLGLSARDINMGIEDRMKVKEEQPLHGTAFEFIQESQFDIIEKDMHRCGFIRESR